MLQRPAVIDELQSLLSDWVASIDSPKLLGAYLFGSTVNDGGVRFQPDKGDLDVILIVDWEVVAPGERVAQIAQLRNAKLELEASLLRRLGREKASEQIVSLVPVTPFEIEQAVHKDGVKHIFKSARAYDLVNRVEVDSLEGGQSPFPLTDEHRSVLGFVQKKRAEVLSVTPNGRGGMSPSAHDDPVPKELMRHFAVATANLNEHQDISDLARGLQGISDFASASAGWTPLTSSFAQWLAVRQGARGDTHPVISHDHYILLVETIFDRVRQQYGSSSGVRFTGEKSAPQAPNATPLLSSSHRMHAEFRVTVGDKIGGTKNEILRNVRAARANMKAGLAEPFVVVFDEEPDATKLLQSDDGMLDNKAHRRKVKAFERRTLIAARQQRWTRGVELILFYGGTLFQGGEDVVEEACRIAIGNWFSVAATNAVNPGGVFEAFHVDFYPKYGMALSFPADISLTQARETTQFLATLEPNVLAGGFVPNLVSKYLHLTTHLKRIELQENQDRVFNVSEWQFGLK